jgi:hypothetical protein
MATLDLPDYAPTKLFRAVVAKLRAHDDLARVVRTWHAMEGLPADAQPATLSQLPWIKLYYGAQPAVPVTISSTQSPMTIVMELIVAGTDQDDLVNLWGAVMRALFPGDGAMGAILRNNGGMENLQLTMPGLAPASVEGQSALHGTGTLTIFFRAFTRV